jgi:2-keto-4-pentenoate hydratase/2-oxohepta-3-ene-1,7-dioic acid hydratase in catechol pathway
MVLVSDVVKNFAVRGRKVVAIGRNYKLHAEELKNAVPTEPFWFLKPPSAYVTQVYRISIGLLKMQLRGYVCAFGRRGIYVERETETGRQT